MKTIYKYPLQVTPDLQPIQMPDESVILSIQMQNNIPCIWALIDNSSLRYVTREFKIIGTAGEVDIDNDFYVGTVIHSTGKLVWHIFEKQREL